MECESSNDDLTSSTANVHRRVRYKGLEVDYNANISIFKGGLHIKEF